MNECRIAALLGGGEEGCACALLVCKIPSAFVNKFGKHSKGSKLDHFYPIIFSSASLAQLSFLDMSEPCCLKSRQTLKRDYKFPSGFRAVRL